MNRIIAWFASNPVAANLLMLVIVVGGLTTLPTIEREAFPSIELNRIMVTVPYPGANAEEVEEGIVIKIEEAVFDLEGVKDIRSTARESSATVIIEAIPGTDIQKFLDDINTRVDAIQTFPEEAERPQVSEFEWQQRVITVAVSGDTDESTLRNITESVRDDLLKLPNIASVGIQAENNYEISIEVAEAALRNYGLSFDQVANAVRGSSVNLPTGLLKGESGDIQLRTRGQAYSDEAFASLVLLTRADGSRVTLADVADINDGFEESDSYALFNNQPALFLNVYQMDDQDILGITDTVKSYVEAKQSELPPGIELQAWRDRSRLFQSRLETLVKNGLGGLVLVFLLLLLFLEFRLALWVSAGIAISFLGAFWLMPAFGLSVNMITMFAFLLVIGIVVDDAIVIGESVYTEQSKGGPRLTGSITGAQNVARPVMFAVITSIIAFLPALSLPGINAQMFEVIAGVVIIVLAFSLIESMLILPAHLAAGHARTRPRRGLSQALHRVQTAIDQRLQRFIHQRYRPALAWVLEWRYLVFAIFLGIFIIMIALMQTNRIRTQFFPTVSGDFIVANLTMNEGTAIAVTEAVAAQLNEALEATKKELTEKYPDHGAEQFIATATVVGHGTEGHRAYNSKGPHTAYIAVALKPTDTFDLSAEGIAKRWRDKIGPIAGLDKLEFNFRINEPGADIDFKLSSADPQQLENAIAEFQHRLRQYPGVYEVSDTAQMGRQEVVLHITPEGESLGITLANLGRQVRQAFYGVESQRIQRGRDEIRVMVRYPRQQRQSLEDLYNMRVRTPSGDQVPFEAVARAELTQGYTYIKRNNRERSVNVTARVNSAIADNKTIMADLRKNFLPELKRKYPALTTGLDGIRVEERDISDSLLGNGILAALAMYALIAILFRSYAKPLIVMLAIPFGWVGSMIGHLVMDVTLSLLSLTGLVAAAGVVINDSLVLLDRVHQLRAQGESVVDALMDAGTLRFRPIVLTSLTTFFGLLPLMAETSVQAQFLIPMATALAYGVLFTTVVCLILIPAVYHIGHDIRGVVRREEKAQSKVTGLDGTG